MKKLLNLKEDFDELIEVQRPDDTQSYAFAELKLLYGKVPTITFHDHDHGIVEMFDEQSLLTFRTISRSNQTEYKASIAKKYDSGELYLNYVYCGKFDNEQVKRVTFIIPELASYFQNELKYRLDNEVNISGNLKIEPILSTVTINGEPLAIELAQQYYLKSFEDNNGFGFTNFVSLSFERDSPFTFSDIKKLRLKITNLFTWITGYPVTIDSINVSDTLDSGYLYLPSVKKTSTYDFSYPNCLMQNHELRNNFDIICKHYFDLNASIFENIWSRTIPLFDFSGVLEYEVMLYTSILDKYFSYQVQALGLKENEKLSDVSIDKLKEFFINDTELPSLIKECGMTVEQAISKLKSKPDSFIQKSKLFLSHIGNQCTEIFISNKHMYDIKDIRDHAAHGEGEKRSTDDVVLLSWKVKLLSMYLIYRDLGIDDQQFLKIFSFNMHPIRLNCKYDEYKLDCALEKTESIRLPRKNLIEYRAEKPLIRVFRKRGESWEYDQILSKASHNYFYSIDNIGKSKEYKSYDDFVRAQLGDESENHDVRFCGCAYLVTKQTQERLHSTIIIEKTKPRKL